MNSSYLDEEVREDQAKGIACANAVWQKAVWKIQETERRPQWLEQREQGELVGG